MCPVTGVAGSLCDRCDWVPVYHVTGVAGSCRRPASVSGAALVSAGGRLLRRRRGLGLCARRRRAQRAPVPQDHDQVSGGGRTPGRGAADLVGWSVELVARLTASVCSVRSGAQLRPPEFYRHSFVSPNGAHLMLGFTRVLPQSGHKYQSRKGIGNGTLILATEDGRNSEPPLNLRCTCNSSTDILAFELIV